MKQLSLLLVFLFAWCTNAQIVNIPDPNLKAWLVAYEYDGIPLDTNGDSEIQVSEAEVLTSFEINTAVNDLTGLEAFINIEQLYLSPGVNVPLLNLNWFPHLKEINLAANQSYTTLDVTGCTELVHLEIELTNISNIIGLSTLTSLKYLDMSELPMTSIDLTGMVSLRKFINLDGQLSSITFPEPNQIIELYIDNNPFTSLDLTPLHPVVPEIPEEINFIQITACQNLEFITMKNGNYRDLIIANCPNLQYICADPDEVEAQAEQFAQMGVEMNDYCSFVPGGVFHTVSGNITYDLTGDGCDASDVPVGNHPVAIDDNGNFHTIYTNADGHYAYYTYSENCIVTPDFSGYYQSNPAFAAVGFSSGDQTADFCYTANGAHSDLEVILTPIIPARPGFDAVYNVTYTNKGNQVQSGTVSLGFDDSVLDFAYSEPTVTSQSENSVSLDFTGLLPFESRSIILTLNVNSPVETPPVNIDDVLVFEATVNMIDTDETSQDNTSVLNQTVVGSLDPNDKTCVEGPAITTGMVGDYLHYVIRFQNSGTFLAENVVVKDIIDPEKFDISTLQLTASSHPQVTRINGDKAEFIFEGINLPAEQDDEPGSHGYVAFKIRTKDNLVLGDTVENTADIFFDFNFPVVTNTASTTISELGLGEFEDTSVAMTPNPVRNVLNVSAEDVISSILIFDIQGRLLQTKLENDINSSIDFSGKSKGVYFVKVQTGKGVKIRKIIKE